MKLVALTGIVCLLTACVSPLSQSHPAYPSAPASEPFSSSPRTAPAGWASEQAWIVAEITEALLNMATPPGAARPAITVTVDAVPPGSAALAHYSIALASGRSWRIAVTDHLWAPQHYEAIAGGLVRSMPRRPCDGRSPLAARLLDLDADVIQRENIRISARLQTNMACAAAHEEAALLLGALALREAAGPFSDPRRLLARMTAHLAVADALHGAPQVVRRLADALLMTLVGRQRSALDLVRALEPDDGDLDLQAWTRALRLRNTGDWRIVPEPRRATLLEQLELLRATAARLGDGPARRLYMTLQDPGDVPDWGRVFLQNGFSVASGNQFAADAIAAELAEAERIRAMHAPAVMLDDLDALVAELTAEPAAGPVHASGAVWVIDWGTWASSAGRHVLMATAALEDHLHRMLRLEGDAADVRAFARRFSPLPLYPALAVSIGRSAAERGNAEIASRALADRRPDLLTSALWGRMVATSSDTSAAQEVRGPAEWFTPRIPPGTAFDAANRLALDGKDWLDARTIADLRSRAPFAPALVWASLRALGDAPAADAVRREIGDAVAYDRHLAVELARLLWQDEAAYVAQMEHVARLDPDTRADLADYLADRGRWADAARQAEQYLHEATDEVGVSRNVSWLLRYYFARGDQEKATVHAVRVARVHSYWGLVARANLHDWRGELDDAERLYRQAAERYDRWSHLLAFERRHQRPGSTDAAVSRRIFPAGVQPLVPATLIGPPTSGVEVTFAGAAGVREGVHAGDIIVAVDGSRVEDLAQYEILHETGQGKPLELVIWRNKGYRYVDTSLRHTWVVHRLRTYQPE